MLHSDENLLKDLLQHYSIRFLTCILASFIENSVKPDLRGVDITRYPRYFHQVHLVEFAVERKSSFVISNIGLQLQQHSKFNPLFKTYSIFNELMRITVMFIGISLMDLYFNDVL